MDRTTLILTRQDVVDLLPMGDCIEAVEAAFLAHAEGRAFGPAVASVLFEGGGFHVKAAALDLSRPYFAAKTNGNFFANESLGLPRIQGTIALCDATNGFPLAILDSIEITTLRTAAATAIAAAHLARPTSSRIAFIGCGIQGHATWRAIHDRFPLREVLLHDLRASAADSLRDVVEKAGASATICESAVAAVREADICITSTPSTEPVLDENDVQPGHFIAAVGSDSPVKNELAPAILHRARVIVDILEQAIEIGEVHHAIDDDHPVETIVAATLGEVIAGRKAGRVSDDDLIVFDSTGTALQDVAAAAIVFERAVATGRGLRVELA